MRLRAARGIDTSDIPLVLAVYLLVSILFACLLDFHLFIYSLVLIFPLFFTCLDFIRSFLIKFGAGRRSNGADHGADAIRRHVPVLRQLCTCDMPRLSHAACAVLTGGGAEL